MKIEEITEFPDGMRIVGLIYHPTFEQEMKMWKREKKIIRSGCDYCDEIADFEIDVGFTYPYYDHYYHHVCKKHLFLRECLKKQNEVMLVMFKCDFCNDVSDYYVRTGDSLDYDYEQGDHYKRRHFVCRKHLIITKCDNFKCSEWYSTYMK